MKKSEIEISIINTDLGFQILDILLTGDGIIKPSDLKNINLPDSIDYTQGIIINGRGPIWLYAHFVHLLHISAFVGVYDPRIGAVIVQSHKSDSYIVGDIIPNNVILKFINKNEGKKELQSNIVCFVGPPHSGKSVLMNLIRIALKDEITDDKYQREFFLVRACPDGEGNWSSEADQKNVKILRYKNTFDDNFVNKVISSINELKQSKKLILVDCGGKIDRYNQMIFNHCTHAVIVSNNDTSILEWIGAIKASNLKILALIDSVIDYSSEMISESPPRFKIGKLERGLNNIQIIPVELLELFRDLIA
mgnify:CR=1 FL=1